MPIDRVRKLVFLHVPKTGGSSIERALGIYGVANEGRNDVPDRELAFGRIRPGRALQHFTLAELGHEGCLPADLSDYTVFAFVRNPWDRLASEYLYLRRLSGGEEPRDFPSFCEALEERIASGAPHFRLQADYVYDAEGVRVVDFLGRFEHLKRDFRRLFRQRGQRPPRLPHLRQAVGRPHYADLYDEDSRDIVEACYAEDIERFDYRFERPGPLDGARRAADRLARRAWRAVRRAAR